MKKNYSIPLYMQYLLLLTLLFCSKLSAQDLSFRRTWIDEVEIKWSSPTQKETAYSPISISQWKPEHSIKVNSDATFSDGKYIYSGKNPFTVYTMKGEYVRTISIPQLPEMYRITYDGTYFYGTYYEHPGIFVFDINHPELVRIIPTKDPMYHITYIPTLDNEKGGFEIGTPAHGQYINMKGETIKEGPNYQADMEEGYFCFASAFFNDKLYVYCSDYNNRKVLEYDIETNKHTGNIFDLNQYVGQGGVKEGFFSQNMITYSHPDHKQYLMLIDYSGIELCATSILVAQKALTNSIRGYNLYRNGIKLNKNIINTDESTYLDQGLAELQSYNYDLKAVTESEETTLYSSNYILDTTTSLPLLEEFETYPLSNEYPNTPFYANYWSIQPEQETSNWTITTLSGNKSLQFYYNPDSQYKQSFISRTLTAPLNQTTRMSLAYCCNYFGNGTDNEYMHIQVSTDNGRTWRSADSILYHANYPEITTVNVDLTQYVSGKDFQIRLKAHGNGGDVNYTWLFDHLKIWSYKQTSIAGTITFAGQKINHSVDVKLQKKGLSTTYQTQTSETGSFNFKEIEDGIYDVTVTDGMHTYLVEDLSIKENTSNYEINIDGGFLTSETTDIISHLGNNSTQKITLKLENAGNKETECKVSAKFPQSNNILSGKSDMAVNYDWSVKNDFHLNSANDTQVFLYKGYYYSKARDFSKNLLNKYDLNGKYLEQIEINGPENLLFSCFFVKNDTLYGCSNAETWQEPAVPAYLIPIDLEQKKAMTEKQISLSQQISYITAAVYDPAGKCIYMRDSSTSLFKLTDQGILTDAFNLPEPSYFGLAIDTYSEGGPFLWMGNKNNTTMNIDIVQYNLNTNAFTTVRHAVNDYSKSILQGADPMNYMLGGCSLISTDQAENGYFSLILLQSFSARNGSSKAQVLSYHLFPLETWIQIDDVPAYLEPGNTAQISIYLNSDGLPDKTSKQATLLISSNNMAEDIQLPVELHIDHSLDQAYPSPSALQAKINDKYQVELTWSIPHSEENPIEGFEILRNGEKISGETLCTEMSFTDQYPYIGQQKYDVTAVYKSGIRKKSVNYAEIQLADPNWGRPVKELYTEIIKEKNVHLKWNKTPEYTHSIYDNFEDYQAFQTENLGEWTLIDEDQMWTYTSNNLDFPQEGTRMAGIIYVPQATTPADLTTILNDGEQAFGFISGNIDRIPNSDWLISRELNLEQKGIIRFDAMTRNLSYGRERIEITYSTTGKDIRDFQRLGDAISIENTWTTIEREIPANTKYVAIHYISQNTFMLFIDRLFIGLARNYSPVSGYNIYRNGEKLNETLLQTYEFTDYQIPNGEYIYEIETVYENGMSAKKSSDVIAIDYNLIANPPRDLQITETKEETLELTWKQPQVAENELLRYDNGEVANSVGGIDSMYVAVKWEAEDLRMYQGYSISGIHFHIAEPVISLTPFIYENNQIVRKGEPLTPEAGKYHDYTFDIPVTIQEGCTYKVGYFVKMDVTSYPISHDAGPATPYKSDLFSEDGIAWYSIYSAYGEEFNINWSIAANLELLATPQPDTAKTDIFLGYNVYRNSLQINEELLTETRYIDQIPEGKATYYVTAVYSISGEKESEPVIYNGVFIEDASQEWKVYPNPANDFINITFEFIQAYLYKPDGILVKTFNPSDCNMYSVQDLEPGTYILIIRTNKHNYKQPIIIY